MPYALGSDPKAEKTHDVVGAGGRMTRLPFANASPCCVSSFKFGITRGMIRTKDHKRIHTFSHFGGATWNGGFAVLPRDCRARLHETCSGLVHWLQSLTAMPLRLIESANLMGTSRICRDLQW